MISASLKRIIIPGLIFQGVVIGGGYSTGRELVEFFLNYGAIGALCGMVLATIIWSFTLAIAFNYAVMARAFDYNSFLKGLLGPLRFVVEVIFFIMTLLVIAVISDAANNIFIDRFGAPPFFGAAFLGLTVCLGLCLPEAWLERVMSFWSILLYVAYFTLFVLVFMNFPSEINTTFTEGAAKPGWVAGALKYAGYNLATVVAVLFSLKHLKSEREARISGALAGVLGMIPAFLLVFAMFAFMPAVLDAPVPLTVILAALDIGPIGLLFDIAILGTLIQTALGSMNALNERVAVEFRSRDRQLANWARGAIGLTMIVLSIGVGVQFGIIQIIAKGYGIMTIGFLLLLVLPIVTVGLWKCIKGRGRGATEPALDA